MEDFILTHGSYAAIVALLALTGAGLPIPEEVVIVAAGVLSSSSVDQLDPVLALLSCLLGAVLGDCVMYGIGRSLGHAFLRRHRWFGRLIQAEREEQMEKIVQQHGLKVSFVARFLVGLRAPIYFAMGVMRVDFFLFLLRDAACAALVVSIFFWLSYFCGGWIGEHIRNSQLAITVVAVVAVAILALYYVVWKKCAAQLKSEDSTESEPQDASIHS